MKDSFGRKIEYLRISLTDRCNLRCRYCMPEGAALVSHDEILRLEEILRLACIFAELGIKKIRLTGGEPLIRKNVEWLVKELHNINGIAEIDMTSNGHLFAEKARMLADAGLCGVNFSLDTLSEERYRNICGAEGPEKVLAATDEALKNGIRTRINTVPMRGVNESELEELAALSENKNIDVRFIEMMPFGEGSRFSYIPGEEILKRLEKRFGKAEECGAGDGPAKYYRLPGFKGKTGFINPRSSCFCDRCNRLRLSSEGFLRLCLSYPDGIDLKALLRGDKSDGQIKTEIENAVLRKPKKHNFNDAEVLSGKASEKGNMNEIGG